MRLAASVGAAARRLRLSCGLPRSRRRSLCAFAVPGLRQPEDCARLAHEAAQACEGLVARVVAGASSPTLDVLYGLDEMSETLCRVLDTMELCRNVHPDPAWAEAANSAYVQLAGHMQMLNTEPRLYEAVDALLQEPRLRTSLTAEQLRFAQSMAAEFQHDGVHLSAERRQQLCALHAEAEELALRFGSGAGGGESLHVLQQLLERRQQIAAALGHSSWATYACAHGRMEADPSAVRGALVRLLEGLRPLAAAEQRELSSETPLGGGAGQTRAAEAAEAEAALRPYLELQSCLDGLEGVLQQAFGLRLVRAAAAEGGAGAGDGALELHDALHALACVLASGFHARRVELDPRACAVFAADGVMVVDGLHPLLVGHQFDRAEQVELELVEYLARYTRAELPCVHVAEAQLELRFAARRIPKRGDARDHVLVGLAVTGAFLCHRPALACRSAYIL